MSRYSFNQKVWNSLEINSVIQNPNSGYGFENGLIFTDSSESEGRSFNFISTYTYKIPSSRFIYSRN